MKILVSKKCVKNKAEALSLTPGLKKNINLWDSVDASIEELAEFVRDGHIFTPGNTLVNAGFEHQQIFFVDIDDGYSENEITAKAYIRYESFSSSEEHRKYRLIFIADKEVTDKDKRDSIQNWLNINCNGDSHCKDAGRLFYPGHSETVETLSGELIGVDGDFYIEEVKTPKIAVKKAKKDHSNKIDISADSLLEKIKEIGEENNLKGKRVSISEAYDIINELSLSDMIGVETDTNFSCLFHADHNPSSRIYVNADGREVYHCFSCGHQNQNVIGTIASILQVSIFKALIITCNELGMKVGSEYQQESRDRILEYQFTLNNALDEYDILKKYLIRNNSIGLLNVMATYAIYRIPFYSYEVNDVPATFFISNNSLYNELKKNGIRGASNCNSKVKKLIRLGLLKVIKNEDLKTSTKKKLEKIVEKNKTNGIFSDKTTSFFYFPELTPEALIKAQEIIVNDKAAGIKQKSIVQSGLCLIEDVKDVYVQTENKVDSNFIFEMNKALTECLQENGIVEKAAVCKLIDKKRSYKWNKKVKSNKYDIYFPMFVKNMNLEKRTVNKSNIHSLKLKLKSRQVFYAVKNS